MKKSKPKVKEKKKEDNIIKFDYMKTNKDNIMNVINEVVPTTNVEVPCILDASSIVIEPIKKEVKKNQGPSIEP